MSLRAWSFLAVKISGLSGLLYPVHMMCMLYPVDRYYAAARQMQGGDGQATAPVMRAPAPRPPTGDSCCEDNKPHWMGLSIEAAGPCMYGAPDLAGHAIPSLECVVDLPPRDVVW